MICFRFVCLSVTTSLQSLKNCVSAPRAKAALNAKDIIPNVDLIELIEVNWSRKSMYDIIFDSILILHKCPKLLTVL